MVVEFVLQQRFSDLNYVNHSKFQGRSTSLNGLQYQYTGYSINLAGGRITLLAMRSPLTLSINPRGA